MKFSTRTTYGLRAMIKLAVNFNNESLSLANIAKAEDISPKYLEKLFVKLKKADLIISEKGSAGGYKLAKNPSEVRVFDVVKVLEGDLSPFHCLNDKGEIHCSAKCNCRATSVLIKVQNAINSTLKSMSLKDLL